MRKLFVERKTYKKNGQEFYTYFIKGNKSGKDFEVNLMPVDLGGYTVLDIIFAGQEQVELQLKPYEIKNESGEVIKGNTYFVSSEDSDGVTLECTLKARRGSDKSLLKMLLGEISK